MMSLNAQLQLANANDRLPAHTAAAARVKNPVLTAFAAAGKGAVPMPNIPAMDSVWGDMGNAWTNTLKGGSSSGALATFRTAGRNIAAKIG
jgi:arabinogalactan oligomer/maltooligosaccharide transport system substrate-binding protein